LKKGGHGKGNWGDATKPATEEGTEEVVEGAAAEEQKRPRRERKEEVVPEKVESEEEEGFTLQDYLNQKAAKNVKLTADTTRQHETLNTKALKLEEVVVVKANI
jgi:hypothetical protein